MILDRNLLSVQYFFFYLEWKVRGGARSSEVIIRLDLKITSVKVVQTSVTISGISSSVLGQLSPGRSDFTNMMEQHFSVKYICRLNLPFITF